MEATSKRPIYTKFLQNPKSKGTKLYGISCDVGWASYIVCTDMYEDVADWLLKILAHKPFVKGK